MVSTLTEKKHVWVENRLHRKIKVYAFNKDMPLERLVHMMLNSFFEDEEGQKKLTALTDELTHT